MIDLGEIQVRILKVGQSSDWSPSSFYLETETPGKFDSFLPRWNNQDGCFDVSYPITQHNMDWTEKHLYMKRGYLVELKRKEIKNPFNKAKQKKWFEEDLKLLDQEKKDAAKQAKVDEKIEKNRQLMGELHAHTRNYLQQVAKAKEYGWPMPARIPPMYDLEKGLGGFYNEALKFVGVEAEELAEKHAIQLKEDEKLQKQGSF